VKTRRSTRSVPSRPGVTRAGAPSSASASARVIPLRSAPTPPAPCEAPDTAPFPSPGAAPAALEAVERAQRRLDAILKAARSGRTFTAQELLGLQAEAYRTVQTVDLATKLVEQGAQSVKQALNTQL